MGHIKTQSQDVFLDRPVVSAARPQPKTDHYFEETISSYDELF